MSQEIFRITSYGFGLQLAQFHGVASTCFLHVYRLRISCLVQHGSCLVFNGVSKCGRADTVLVPCMPMYIEYHPPPSPEGPWAISLHAWRHGQALCRRTAVGRMAAQHPRIPPL